MEIGILGLTARHKELLREMEAIFLEEGCRDLTVADLASKLRCSKRSLYEIATSKQELFLLVVEIFLHRIREMGLKASFEKDNAVDKIRAYLAPGVSESQRIGEFFFRDLLNSRAAKNALDMHQRERTVYLQNILEAGIKAGELRLVNSALVAEMFMVCVGQLSDTSLLHKVGLSYSEAMHGVFDLVLQGVEIRT